MLSIDAKVVEKAKNIKLLILDVDGVMTDGGVIINKDGSESKQFYAQDGHGLMILKSLNIEYAIISGRYSKAVEFRGNELGFKTIIQNSRDKLADYKKHFSDFYNSNFYFLICFWKSLSWRLRFIVRCVSLTVFRLKFLLLNESTF